MGRLLPHRFDLADPTGNQDKVAWAFAHHLVSDVDVGATRVASRGVQALPRLSGSLPISLGSLLRRSLMVLAQRVES